MAAETPDPAQLTALHAVAAARLQVTISAPPVGFNATDDFLFGTRLGFCQHFSSAYAVFMRAAGVPARVVTGYVGGHYNKLGGYWLLKNKDAHAWTEIWLDGRGWVRVDPTAAIAPENILDTLDDLQARQQAGLAGPADQVLGPMFDGTDFLRRQWNQLVLGFDAARQKSLLKPLGIDEADAGSWSRHSASARRWRDADLWFLPREHRDRSHPIIRAWRAFTRRSAGLVHAKEHEEPPLAFAQRLAERLLAHVGLLSVGPALQRLALCRPGADRRRAGGTGSLVARIPAPAGRGRFLAEVAVQRASGQQMQMQVEYSLPAVAIDVHQDPVAALGEAFAFGVAGCRQHQTAE
jgi:hypothetical protein